MIKNTIIACAFFLFLPNLLCALDRNGNFESIKEQDEYVSLSLKKTAREINSQTPIMIDSDTQLSSVLALEKNINFNYKLVNISSKQIDPGQLRNYALNNMNDNACKNKATRDLIDLGVKYVYIYWGNDDLLITRVVLDNYNCNF